MSLIFSAELAGSVSGSSEPECERKPSARSIPTAAPSSPSTGPTSPATTMSQLSLPLDLPQTGSSRLWATPQARDHFPAHKPEYIAAKKAQGHGMRNLNDEVSASLQAGSHAKIFQPQEKAQALQALARDYGASTPELLARYDPATSSWRTSQHCLVEGLTVFSETWPRSGLMRNGTAYQLPPLVRLTDETGSGLWRTPNSQMIEAKSTVVKLSGRTPQDPQVGLADQVMAVERMWPTPQARDWKDGNNPKQHGRHSDSLPVKAAMYPTPTANRRDGLQSHGVNVITGSLNPTWVEWLMGFPLGWTVLEASAMPSSRRSQKLSAGPSS